MICQIFSRVPRLENYIRNLLNPYLLGWLWYQQFNEMPWGERTHGLSGLVESYQELLNIKNRQCLLDFMYKYIRKKLFQRQDCPCGSGLPFKKCHKNLIIRLENCLPDEQLLTRQCLFRHWLYQKWSLFSNSLYYKELTKMPYLYVRICHYNNCRVSKSRFY
jgi:hypothetical protein